MPKKLPPMKSIGTKSIGTQSIGTVIVFLVVGLISLGAYYVWQRRALREGFDETTNVPANKNPNRFVYVKKLTALVDELSELQQTHEKFQDETSFAISYATLHQFRLNELLRRVKKEVPDMYDWPTLTNTPKDIKTIKDILDGSMPVLQVLARKGVEIKAPRAPTNKEECNAPGEEMFNTCFYKGEMGDFIVGRQDKSINFDWKQESPDPAVPADNFSASWVGAFLFDDATYMFTATGDDGIRLSINGTPVQFDGGLDGWKVQGPTTYTYTTNMKAGPNTLKFEYYEQGGGAVAKLNWEKKN